VKAPPDTATADWEARFREESVIQGVKEVTPRLLQTKRWLVPDVLRLAATMT